MSRDHPSDRTRAVARVVTETTGPALCAIAALMVVALADSREPGTVLWATVAAVFVAALPMAFIAQGVRAGRWSDHHVDQRSVRLVPLLVAAAFVTLGLILLVILSSNRSIIAVMAAMLVGLMVVLAITRWWKISIHCAVAGGLVAVLSVTFGPTALIGVAGLVAVAWSRRVLDAHTWPQALVGSVIGGAVAFGVFPLVR